MLGPMQGREYSLYYLYLWSLQGYAFFTLWTIQFVVDTIDYVAVFDTIHFV